MSGGTPITAVIMATGPAHRISPAGAEGWATPVAGEPAIARAIARLKRCEQLAPPTVIAYREEAGALSAFLGEAAPVVAVDAMPRPRHDARIRLARGWSPSAWRGGIGNAACFDEWLDPAALVEAMDTLNTSVAVAVAADWPLVDPAMCDRLAERHLELPEKRRMVFSQAAPGLCGILLERSLLSEMAEHGTTVGWMLDYNPSAPTVDPIGRDVCVQAPPAVRAPGVRVTSDAPRWTALLDAALTPDEPPDAQTAARRMQRRLREVGHALPQQLTVELTPRRAATGPAALSGGVDAGRPDMTPETFAALGRRLRDEQGRPRIPDLALTFAGLGDPLLHPAFDELVRSAATADAASPFACLAWETDLLVTPEVVDRLLALNIPMVIRARLNAATAETYAAVMGLDGFEQAVSNLARLAKADRPAEAPLLVVPMMVKCRDNVHELEPFVDRWQSTLGACLVTGPSDGAGLVDDVSVLDMAPPRRFACRQLAHRMTVLSDGSAPRCDQDWLARESAGNICEHAIETMWAQLQDLRRTHEQGSYPGLCEGCRHWHRP